ncbi:(R)-1-hydroxy-2-aminoethylphosphonate ammonia-lyase [Paenibacillus glycanilyticus]|uniref:Aspartate aminotransferase family protein n=1 Tax=Paenibacillus glycanilyticus TaxID=126569 RepID=A0ABQ6GD32_9BACL|nr:aspartate aminotransferase family protein [Paenibacillus glycanilyticus]GLX67173.1 aspartate aminotransferase family protein [Paenibacillus glycanilyticus]
MEYSREQGDINKSSARSRYWDRNLSLAARAVYEEDNRYFLHQSLSTPVLNVLSKAEGIYIYDMDGKPYIDMHGNGVHNAGFNNDDVIEAVIAALRSKNTFSPRRYTNEHAVALAKKLVEITPDGLDRVLFAPGGSEAIEMAVMLAKQITGKWKTISFWDSYHGNGFQASSIGGERLFKAGNGPMVPGALHVEFPNYYRNPWGFDSEEAVDNEILRQMELLFEREGDIACVIGEPISATPIVPSSLFWERVKSLCEKHGALLIFDEIIEGFGRTGRMFAAEHSVTPDILVLGKSLGGGVLPFAGIVTREEYNVLGHLSIGHFTHEKNGLCASAGLAMIDYLERHRLVENAEEVGRYALEWLEGLRERCPLVGNVNGVGLHIGVELVKDRATKEKAIDEAEAVMYKAMERGVAFKIIESNVITLRPSLVITKEQMRFALEQLELCLQEVASGSYYY